MTTFIRPPPWYFRSISCLGNYRPLRHPAVRAKFVFKTIPVFFFDYLQRAVSSTATFRLVLRLRNGGRGQKLFPAGIAAKEEGLSIALGVESGRLVHSRHVLGARYRYRNHEANTITIRAIPQAPECAMCSFMPGAPRPAIRIQPTFSFPPSCASGEIRARRSQSRPSRGTSSGSPPRATAPGRILPGVVASLR